jgi:hypothetical protein
MRVLRLFNDDAGKKYLRGNGVSAAELERLPLLGISSISNLLAAIKTAKHFELKSNDVVFTIFTDSVELYRSRLKELREERGSYSLVDAAKDHAGPLLHQGIDFFKELTYYERKAIHHLKYFTWVEQQGKSSEELDAQWDPGYWRAIFEDEVAYFDKLIEEFNGEVGRAG